MIAQHLKKLPLTREASLLVLAYLYLPIFVLIGYSFNANRSATVWTEFSFAWYERIINNPSIQVAALNSLVVASTATVLSTSIALLAALATSRPFYGRRVVEGSINLPLLLPEIVIAVATLLLFMSLGIKLGLVTVTIAHVGFCIPFAYLPIRARLNDMDKRLLEAAGDLYANPYQVFRRVTLPLLWPAVLSGAVLAFVVSLDDFIMTFFVAGPGSTTLPVYIFSAIRAGVTPEINAISTVMLVVSIVLVVLSYWLGQRGRSKAN
ncbi:ABC transporter permease [Pseudomonas guariconensis]|uniref:ABC transporter permease n=1 Tax=Pseudomonas guariconensis TaxID=1288410 RepID=UPI0018A9BE67|nr:ABC transporter permease [Pseudomonas guariconensis]MBF8732765.1 ABC transporter permease [Pseudomonas guariconensis]